MSDQELCTIVFDDIVSIEVHLKSYMASELAKTTGPFGCTVPGGLPGLSSEERRSAIANITSDYQQSSGIPSADRSQKARQDS